MFRTSAIALAGVGLALTISGMTFAQGPSSVGKSSVKSAMVTLLPNDPSQHHQSNQHGTITVMPLGHGQWQATWTWRGLIDGLPPLLLGWEGTHVTEAMPNIMPPHESKPVFSGDTVTIDFTQPASYPKHPEVVQFYDGSIEGPTVGAVSPLGQLPEVPWSAALPLLLVAPLAFRMVRKRPPIH